MITLEVLNPGGVVRSSVAFAPRLGDLNGKTVGMLSNTLGEADRTFPHLIELFAKHSPTTKIVSHLDFPQGGDRIDADDIVEMVKTKGCQAVILGNAQ